MRRRVTNVSGILAPFIRSLGLGMTSNMSMYWFNKKLRRSREAGRVCSRKLRDLCDLILIEDSEFPVGLVHLTLSTATRPYSRARVANYSSHETRVRAFHAGVGPWYKAQGSHRHAPSFDYFQIVAQIGELGNRQLCLRDNTPRKTNGQRRP